MKAQNKYVQRLGNFLKYKLLPFSKEWPEICYGIPLSLLVFVFNGSLIRGLDPSANILNVENLSILNFNLLIAFVVNCLGYFFYTLCFHDYFRKGWDQKPHPNIAVIVNYMLWATVFVTNYFIITKNL